VNLPVSYHAALSCTGAFMVPGAVVGVT
jgi:hypothetical protein